MAEKKDAKGTSLGIEYGEEQDEEEEEDDSDPFSILSRGGASSQFVLVRGQGGQAYRVPISLLRRIMADQNNDDEGDEEE